GLRRRCAALADLRALATGGADHLGQRGHAGADSGADRTQSSVPQCDLKPPGASPIQLNSLVDLTHILLLLGAALIAGALNSIAGGGSFLSFPLLLFLGMPSVTANATNTVALWPGTIASTGAYRRALSWDLLRRMMPLIAATLTGSLVGALL